MIKPDIDVIILFLKKIHDNVHLCSIVPDGSCKGRWFGNDIATAAEWALSENKLSKNLYWTVNIVTENCHKKPSKKDIVAARFVHVDVDPPKGGGVFDKLKIAAEMAALPVPPSLIIDSGGGLQAFWPLAGSVTLSEVESINKNISGLLGGDHCHSIDHLMRIPGTVNYPNANKIAAGRSLSLAKVIYDADGILH